MISDGPVWTVFVFMYACVCVDQCYWHLFVCLGVFELCVQCVCVYACVCPRCFDECVRWNLESRSLSVGCACLGVQPRDGTTSATATTPDYLRNTLGITTNGMYYISTAGLGQTTVVQAYVSFGMLDGKDWIKVFELAQTSTTSGNVVTDLLGSGLPWKGFNLNFDGVDYYSYYSSYKSYSRGDFGSTTFGGNMIGAKVILGYAGGHGWYNPSQSACAWGSAQSAGAVGAGTDNSSNSSGCGSYPAQLRMGTGSSLNTGTYTMRTGTWSFWIWMDVASPESPTTSVSCLHTCLAGYSDNNNGAGQRYSCVAGAFSGTLLSCSAVPCPANSSGGSVPLGCICNAGFSGSVVPTSTAPYSTSCRPVACPLHSFGIDVATGCSCLHGYSGTVQATRSPPYYTSSCQGIACLLACWENPVSSFRVTTFIRVIRVIRASLCSCERVDTVYLACMDG
jgi:hypothetical protein